MRYEEAIGFCLGSLVNDKDGVSAGAVFAEMANTLQREHGRSVLEHLDTLYDRVGRFVQNNGCAHPCRLAPILPTRTPSSPPPPPPVADGRAWAV